MWKTSVKLSIMCVVLEPTLHSSPYKKLIFKINYAVMFNVIICNKFSWILKFGRQPFVAVFAHTSAKSHACNPSIHVCLVKLAKVLIKICCGCWVVGKKWLGCNFCYTQCNQWLLECTIKQEGIRYCKCHQWSTMMLRWEVWIEFKTLR